MQRNVFITGGTGYIGQVLIPRLLERGHVVRALARQGSVRKLPSGCEAVTGNALDASSFADRVHPSDTFVQLVGVPHPSPSKAAEFQSIDLVSVRASVAAAAGGNIKHFIYVSVAQPAPVMKTYQSARAEAEKIIRASGLEATILRPWYVLGPGHRWSYALIPFYWLLERIPGARDSARRLGLVTRAQMVNALIASVEAKSSGIRVLQVSSIKSLTSPTDGSIIELELAGC
ncbi:MAG: NAD(P)H-binding protein [Blastocatellia bacterium]